ncbi:M16 family metallopeptidase [Kiloniella sp. b19]|uniref:M16 family metallopeptidase n=1 Tax=Kiloniella sp. GXU_MW_B19 TaxID=3141326 RepID=UPI0031D22B1B
MKKTAAIVLFFLVSVTGYARAYGVQKVVSESGIEALLIEDHTTPLVSVEFSFEGGATADPEGKEGLSVFLSSTLDEGAGQWNSRSFQKALADDSITLYFSSGRESFGGTFVSRLETLPQAQALLKAAINEPRFEAEAVERIREQIRQGLQSRKESPSRKIQTFARELYFPAHTYSRAVDGSEDTLDSMTADDLRQLHRALFARSNLHIGVSGAISAEELSVFLDAVFGALPLKPEIPFVEDIQPQARGGLVVIDEQIPQSLIYGVQPGLSRHDPDFYAAYVINHILGGGGFQSRLYQSVREERGLVYSINTSLYDLDHSPLILVSAATQNARVGETVALLREEWKRMQEEGPTARELEEAKLYLTGSYPLRFTSTGRIAGMLLSMHRLALPLDFLEKRNSYIEALSLADVQRVAGRLLDTEALTLVIAGQPEGVVAVEPERLSAEN